MDGNFRFSSIEAAPQHVSDSAPAGPPENAGGYVLLYRKSLDSQELAGDAKSMGLFVILLLLARWSPGYARGALLSPGQLAVTHKNLCERTGLSVMEVRTRLEKFKAAAIIRSVQVANRYHLITITKWTTYQQVSGNREQTQKQAKNRLGTDREPTGVSNYLVTRELSAPNKGNTGEGNALAPSALGSDFERFWQAYPKKRNKGQAEKAWSRLAPAPGLCERIRAALETVKASPDWRKDDGRFIPYPATWIHARGWEDELVSLVPAQEPASLAYHRAPSDWDEQ